jgi:hypothetical protein
MGPMRHIAILVLLFATAAGLGWAATSLGDDIVPGVRAAGIDIGGRSAASARERLLAQSAVLEAVVVAVVGEGSEWRSTNGVLQDGRKVSRDAWYSHYAPVWGGPAR